MQSETFVIQCENSLAGALLIEPYEVVQAVRPLVSESDFLTDQARAIYKATVELVNSGKPCDALLIQQAAGPDVTDKYCAEAMRMTPTTVNSSEYASIIHNAAQERLACAIGFRLVQGEQSPVETLASLQELLRAQNGTVLKPGEAAQRFADFVSNAAAGKTKPFLRTGYRDLDSLLSGGLIAGGLITLAARPGVGKTMCALNIAENIAGAGYPVLYISLEMPLEQIWSRRCGIVSGLSHKAVYAGNFREDDAKSWKRWHDAMQMLSERPLYVRDVPSTVEEIEKEARCIDGLKLLVIDYMGLIALEGQKASRYETATLISHRLKQLALSLKIPILAACQLNRSSTQTDSKRPRMSDLRDSGAIEEDSDVVILLFREAENWPEENKPKAGEQQSIDFDVAKNRHGRTGVVRLQCCLENGRVLS